MGNTKDTVTFAQAANNGLAVKASKEMYANPTELLKLELLTSLEKYTRAMFKAQYKRSFAISGHHRQLFNTLEQVVDGNITRLIINMPPRYSKTEVVVKSFISWCFALNPTCRFLHLSYSDMLVNDNSAVIRQIMQEPVYQQLFPNSALAKDKESSTRWKTKAGGELYAVSTQGQVTGFGAGKVDNTEGEVSGDTDTAWANSNSEFLRMLGLLEANQNIFEGAIIIDDPLKPEDAMSDTVRERINTRFETTIRNRTNSRKTPIIIIMQRLHEHDLCGYLLDAEPDEWTVLSLPAIVTDEDGSERPLWALKHTLPELYKIRALNSLIFDTQYMQDPKPKEGLMYSSGFNTYQPEALMQLTGKGVHRCNYTDTADTGADSLCSINFIDTPEFIYITDVLFSDKAMEVTEPQTAEMLHNGRVEIARIESNNGGRGFARNVATALRVKFRNNRIRVETFHQADNKYVRIFTKSAEVQNIILMPVNWDRKWPKFHQAITSYRKDNKKRSQHDDAPDALTGVVEMHNRGVTKRKCKRTN